MAKQLNVSLAFTADTRQAKAQLQDLQNQLSKLSNIQSSGKDGFFLTKDIQQASMAAVDLKNKLAAATDVNTGKLNLSAFDQSLRSSGTSLETYRKALSGLGVEGDKAFAALATSIQKADVPLRTTNRLLSEFKTTLMNTARWQISSSVLHGFMGTLQSAYRYAQDLNESLTNIQIVTGHNVEYMSQFADRANKAAQALSTTTTAYTDAALIFYQQGLNDKDVEARTDATIKMAQATGDSATEVSSYMTAIWNNFDDGSESLEHYADVITALGASTASSSSEIASGLQQFASIAKTTGLSYDYATSALATLVANTRQSADTIGNSLKTIFSRLQGLKMGETLEDGLDLNKYSQALKAIGVDVLDVNGNMMEMDDVLDETAEKWETMTQAQKMAFAQTVAGTRQYNQLMSLMDNWDDMQSNLQTAENADGTLQKQADIYAKSWEAAQKRVKAAAEEIYNDLLNDDFFITILDGFKLFLNGINDTIDAMGGLKGVLITVGALVTNIFKKELANEINRIANNIQIVTGKAESAAMSRKQEASREMGKLTQNAADENTGNAMNTVYSEQNALQTELVNKAEQLSEVRRQELQSLLDVNAALGDQVIKSAEAADAAERELEAEKQIQQAKARRAVGGASTEAGRNAGQAVETFTSQMGAIGRMEAGAKGLKTALQGAVDETGKFQISSDAVNGVIERMQTELSTIKQTLGADSDEALELETALAEAEAVIEKIPVNADNMLEGSKQDADELIEKMNQVLSKTQVANDAVMSGADGNKGLEELGNKAYETGVKVENARQKVDSFKTSSKSLGNEIKKPSQGMTDFGQKAMIASQAIMTTTMVINNLISAFQLIKDPDVSGWEQFKGILGSFIMTIPMVISLFVSLHSTFGSVKAAASEMWIAIGGHVGLIIAGIVALSAVLIGLFAYNNYKNSPEQQLKRISKASEEAQEGLENAKKAYQDLQQSLSDLDSGIDAISEMTRGTVEWRNAINDSNDSLIKLLSTYGKLSSTNYTIDSDGLMHLKDGVKEELEQIAQGYVDTAQMTAYAMQKMQYQAQQVVDDKEAGQVLKDNANYYESYGNGEAVDTADFLADSAMQTLADSINDASADFDITSFDDVATALYGTTDGLTGAQQAIVDSITSNTDVQTAAYTLANKVNTNSDAISALNNTLISQKFGDQIKDSIDPEALTNMMGDQLGQITDDLYNTKYKDMGKFGGGMSDEDVQEEYRKARGYERSSNEGDNMGKYLTNGEWIEVSDEAARMYLAQQEAMQQINGEIANATGETVNYIEVFNDMINDLSQKGEEGALALSMIAGTDIKNMTAGEAAGLTKYNYKDANGKTNDELIQNTYEELKSDLGLDDNGMEMLMREVGAETQQELIDKWNANVDYLQNLQEKITSQLKMSAQKVLTDGGLQDKFDNVAETIDLSNYDNFVNQFNDITTKLGGDAGAQFIEGMSALKDGLEKSGGEFTEEEQKFLNGLQEIDLTAPGAEAKVRALANEFGIAESDIGSFIDILGDFEVAIVGTSEAVAKAIGEIDKIVSNLKQGDTISDEDYNKLITDGISEDILNNYFMTMSDGTHKLIGDAESFADVVKNIKADKLIDARNSIINQQGELDSMKTTTDSYISMSGTDKIDDFTATASSDNTQLLSAQIAYLQEMGDLTVAENEHMKEMQQTIENGGDIGAEEAEKVAQKVAEATTEYNNYDEAIKENNQELQKNEEMLVSLASSYEELQRLMVMGVSDDALVSGLQNVALQYESCSEAVKEYQDAIVNGTEQEQNAARYKLEIAVGAAEAAKEYGIEAERISELAKILAEGNEALLNNSELATDAAVRNIRLNDAVEDLYDNWDDYKEILDMVNSTTYDSVDAIKKEIRQSGKLSSTFSKLKSSVAGLLNVSEDMFGDDFIIKNMNKIKKAAEGDEEAIKELQEAAAEEIALDLDDRGVLDKLGSTKEELADWANNLPEGELGLDDTAYLQKLVYAMQMAGMAQEDIEEKLRGMGIDVDLSPMEQSLAEAAAQAGIAGAETSNAFAENAGVDTEVKSETTEDEDTKEAVGWEAVATEVPLSGSVPNIQSSTDGGVQVNGTIPLTGSFPSVDVTSTNDTQTETKTTTATALEVKGANKSSGGNLSHSNRPGGRNRAGRSGGGRRGGGGRRESRPKERQNKDTKKHREIEGDLKVYDEEIERYHEIEKSIDNIQEKLDKYENIAGRAFGKAKVKALKDSAKAYKDLAKAYNTELQENQDWLNKDIAKARDYGWKLDADGNVSNYEENMKRLVNAQNAAEEKYLREYNKAVAWFNSLSGDAQAEEGNKKKFENLTKKAEEDLEDANKLYEDSVEALKQVEESQEKREELIKQQREALQKALDAEVEAVDVTVQVRLDIADADLKLLKEILEQIGDSADGAADAIGVIGQEVGDLEAKAKAARQGIAETLAVYTDRDLLGDNALDQSLVDKIMAGGELTVDDKESLLAAGITEDTIDKIESYGDELIDVNGALRDLRDEALQKTSDAFDEFVENLDRSSEKIQHLQKVTETYKNIIDIVGKKVIDASGELTKQLGKANFEMQRNNTHALKSELEFIDQSIQNQKDAIARLMSDNANGQHDEAIKQMNQQLKEMEDQRDSTYESWLDSWQAEMQAVADIYAETLESVVDNFSDSLAGAFGSLDELEEEFSRKKEIQDLYLDDYRQIYELSKLTRDINKSIDDTDNIKSKQALKSLMKDIEQMQENGVKLSEYDLENLQRQYELELAKQQLKESQEAKSEVRMTRDSEGNYGYVYTADSNAVAEAEQNYEDKLYAMQKANADYIEDLQNNIISAEQACADALAELDASQFASYEEYQEAVARVQADYSELIEGYYQQIGNALDNNRNLYQTEWTEYNVMTGYKISADEDYIDSFNETRLSILTGYSDIETAQEAWNQAVNAATNEAALAYEEWYERTQIALADGETSMQDFGTTVNEVTEDVLDRAEEAENSADAMADSYADAYTDILNALGDFCTNYDSKIQDIISSNTELVKSINKVTKAAANLDDYNNKKGSGSGNGGSGSGSGSDGGNNNSGGGNGNGGSNSGDEKKKGKASWDKGYAAYKRINAGAWGNGISNRISAGAKEGFSKAEVELGQKIINYTYPRSLHGLGYSMDKAKSLLGYDTGGYTGNWNSSDGKLALLHKKELVLNKDDTENMLKAVEVIREINKTIDLNALSASSGFASLLSSSSMINDNSQEIQQTVSIEASFPGVTERGEIEEAFNNLINRAAQFVNRKN